MKRSIRTAALGAGTLALLLLPAGRALADGAPTPPAAVIESLAPGGDAFTQAVRLDATAPGSGDVDPTKLAPTATRFGSPHQLRSSWRSTSTDEALGDSDFDAKWGTRWLSVEYVGGKPVNAMLVEPTGAFVQFGWDPAQIPALDALPDGAQLVGASSVYGEELYQLSDDARTVTALTPAAQALIGDDPVPATTFRNAKRAQLDERLREQAEQPKGAIGGAPAGQGLTSEGSGSSFDSQVAFVAAIALSLIGIIAGISKRRRRAQAELQSERAAFLTGAHTTDREG